MKLADSELNIMNTLVWFMEQCPVLWMFCKFPLRELILLSPHKLVIATKCGEGTPIALVAVYSSLKEFVAFKLSSASG